MPVASLIAPLNDSSNEIKKDSTRVSLCSHIDETGIKKNREKITALELLESSSPSSQSISPMWVLCLVCFVLYLS